MINNFKTNVKVRKTPRNGSYNYIGLKKLLILLSRQGRVPILLDFPFSLGCSISIGLGVSWHSVIFVSIIIRLLTSRVAGKYILSSR